MQYLSGAHGAPYGRHTRADSQIMNDKCTDLDMEETAPLKNHYRHSVDAVFNERMLNLEENLP